MYRSSHRRCSIQKGVLKIFGKFTGKHLCKSLFSNKVAGLSPTKILKETLAQMSSCEFCEIFKSNFFYRTPPVAVSTYHSQYLYFSLRYEVLTKFLSIEKLINNLPMKSGDYFQDFTSS